MISKQLVYLVVLFRTCQAVWNVTCDLDLDNIKEIINYLPIECQEIYKSGATSELYQASLKESEKFQQFYNELYDYERKESSTPIGEVPEKNFELRFEIYNTTLPSDCVESIGNNTDSAPDEVKANEFYDCLAKKREQMIHLIPKQSEKKIGKV